MKLARLLLPLAFFVLYAQSASAQFSDEYGYQPSRELLAISIGAGVYQPNVGNPAFDQVFDGEKGPLLSGGIDFRLFRLGDFAAVIAGPHMGWARYGNKACNVVEGGALDCGSRVDETTTLKLFPLSLMGGITLDVLARKWRIPFYLTGRVGLDTVFYGAKTGGVRDAAGASFGLRWEAELDLELDFFERRAARALDDEWGINHTYLFAKILGSTAASKLPVGTRLGWVVGLGLVF